MQAKDIMNRDVLTVRPDLTVDQLARFLIESEISGAPVADEQGRLLGVVSLRDVAQMIGEDEPLQAGISDYYVLTDEQEGFDFRDLDGLQSEHRENLVYDIMNPKVHSVSRDADVSQIAKTMLDAGIHRILVTEDERLLGIITTMDLLRLLVSKDFES